MFLEPFETCHALAQDLSERLRGTRGFEKVESNPQKQRAGRGDPEGIGTGDFRKEHVRDALQIIDAAGRMLGDVGERIPARGATILRKRIEEVTGLAARLAIACRDRPVFTFYVDAHERARPIEGVGHHNAHAFAAARRRCECNTLLTL